MPEEKNTRNYPSQSTLSPHTRLEATRSPAAGKTHISPTPQLSHQERTALVEKLIDFLKSI